jgi:hypothetical protein
MDDNYLYGIEVLDTQLWLGRQPVNSLWSCLQAVGFLDKRACDVRTVEIARAVKMTKTNIEQIQFTVPRVKVLHYLLVVIHRGLGVGVKWHGQAMFC